MRLRFSTTGEAINGGGEEDEEENRVSKKKKQGASVREWLTLDEYGNQQLMEVGKHAIMRRTGLPARDLRALDPLLSYPSSILGREKAIVMSLEHIKAIITAHEVLLLNPRDPSVAPFAAHLQGRITQLSRTSAQQKGGNGDMDMGLPDENSFLEKPDTKIDDSKWEINVIASGAKVLPFEFRALEACLEAACSSLESEAGILEEEAYPTLDELTSKVSTLKLERVRQIKSRLVVISGRVQKISDELEHLLDDEDDMAEMYLTRKLMQQQDEVPCPSPFHGARFGMEQELAHSDAEDDSDVEALTATFNTLGRDREGRSSRNHCGTKDLGIEELEMLLEAYFVQIDGTLNKLSALKEYVDDTEDYINIMLDDKQNHLLQMGVVLTTANLIINFFVTAAGVFGINIRTDLFNFGGFTQFLWFLGSSSTACIFLFIGAIAYFKYRRLL